LLAFKLLGRCRARTVIHFVFHQVRSETIDAVVYPQQHLVLPNVLEIILIPGVLDSAIGAGTQNLNGSCPI
jgi:hypothetical protein